MLTPEEGPLGWLEKAPDEELKASLREDLRALGLAGTVVLLAGPGPADPNVARETFAAVKRELGCGEGELSELLARYAEQKGARGPAKFVHNDYSFKSAPRSVRDHLPEEADRLLRSRFAEINVWRAIRGPIESSPLALCDARSLGAGEIKFALVIKANPNDREEIRRITGKPCVFVVIGRSRLAGGRPRKPPPSRDIRGASIQDPFQKIIHHEG